MNTLPQLIESAEKAQAPDRELECRIWSELFSKVPFEMARAVVPDLLQWQAPYYTHSIDQALLVKPNGAQWSCDSHHNTAEIMVYRDDPQSGPDCHAYPGEGSSLPFAIVAASLRAHMSQDHD